jgi:hypothetical protein
MRMHELMTGALAMAFAVVAVFFVKFWLRSGDRLFAFFAMSFLVLAVNRMAIVIFADYSIHDDFLYWVRLSAFILILVGILDKNRSPVR